MTAQKGAAFLLIHLDEIVFGQPQLAQGRVLILEAGRDVYAAAFTLPLDK